MPRTNNSPDRLTIDEGVRDSVIPLMKENEFFGGLQNADYLLFAFSLGYEYQLKKPMKHGVGGGWVRSEYLSDKFRALINSVHLSEVGYDHPDAVREQAEAYSDVEQYANTGFQMIEGDLANNPSAETYANNLLAELDKKYEEFFNKSAIE